MSLRYWAGRVQRIRFISNRVSFTLMALAIEFLDELIGGVWMVALPLIQTDLHLSYTQIGLLSTVPNLVSSLIEPALGIWGNLGHRKKLILGGGLVFALAAGLLALSQQWWVLLLAFTLLHPASGAFTSLTQAALMDSDPARHEQNMARWGAAGSLGSLAGALAASVTIACGWGWRGAFAAIALLTLAVVRLLWHRPFPQHRSSSEDCAEAGFWQGLCQALRSLRQWPVLRWLILLEAAELMLEVFTALLPLYLVSIAQLSTAQIGLAITVWMGVGLVGDVLVIPLLARVQSLRYLHCTADAISVPDFPAGAQRCGETGAAGSPQPVPDWMVSHSQGTALFCPAGTKQHRHDAGNDRRLSDQLHSCWAGSNCRSLRAEHRHVATVDWADRTTGWGATQMGEWVIGQAFALRSPIPDYPFPIIHDPEIAPLAP